MQKEKIAFKEAQACSPVGEEQRLEVVDFQKSDLILDDYQIYQKFLKGLRTEKTRIFYRKSITSILTNPPEFMSLARKNRWQVEELLLDWILGKDGVAGARKMKKMKVLDLGCGDGMCYQFSNAREF